MPLAYATYYSLNLTILVLATKREIELLKAFIHYGEENIDSDELFKQS